MQHVYERTVLSRRTPAEVFADLDDIQKLTRHMLKPSAAMFGSRLELIVDKSRAGVGERYGWRGRVLGLPITIDEEVTLYDPPREKRWCTVGTPQLIVHSRYCVSFALRKADGGTRTTLRLEYDLPTRGWRALVGRLLGHSYARWCVDRMAADISS
jgi:hypothetical protein